MRSPAVEVVISHKPRKVYGGRDELLRRDIDTDHAESVTEHLTQEDG